MTLSNLKYVGDIQRRLEKLGRDGVAYRLASGASPAAVLAAERRLGQSLPGPVSAFYAAYDGLLVEDPAFEIFGVAGVERKGDLLLFCRCDRTKYIGFDAAAVNEAGQWSIVSADTRYRVTYTIQSFLATVMWSWIVKRRSIWQPCSD